jgi:cytochrome c551/c552
MRWNWTMCFVAMSGALTLTACDKKPSAGDSTASTGAATSAGDPKAYFKMKCTVCHGENGMGDGPGGAALDPHPRNFTDATWQGQVKDEEIKKAILEGGASVGKSAAMPPNPDLKGKDEMINGLLKIVRGFKK